MNEEEMAELNTIMKDRAASKLESPLPPAPIEVEGVGKGGMAGEPYHLSDGTFKQIVELVRRDAKQEFNVETAKLDFAGGAAWAIASFGIAMIAMVAWLGFKRTLQPSKLIALGLIVTAALLLIVLGYTDEQMSPVIGLLGTIAGYMLGSKEWDGNDAAATTAADAEISAAAAITAAAAAQEAAAAATAGQAPEDAGEPATSIP